MTDILEKLEQIERLALQLQEQVRELEAIEIISPIPKNHE